MTPPDSLRRVFDTLRALMPPGVYLDDENGRVLRELMVISWVLARIVDRAESLLDHFFMTPGFTDLIERFERFLKLPVRPLDDPTLRINRILNIWRRRIGYQTGPLLRALAPLLDCEPTQLVLFEAMRAPIDAATTFQVAYPNSGLRIANNAVGLVIRCDTDWPDRIDDTGVRITVEFAAADATDVELTLSHKQGGSVTFWPNAAGAGTVTAVYEERKAFFNRPAAGPWFITAKDPTQASGNAFINSISMRASNDLDSSAIYCGFVYRDPAIGGAPDLSTAQASLNQIGVAHVAAFICEQSDLVIEDAQSLTNRDPIGV